MTVDWRCWARRLCEYIVNGAYRVLGFWLPQSRRLAMCLWCARSAWRPIELGPAPPKLTRRQRTFDTGSIHMHRQHTENSTASPPTNRLKCQSEVTDAVGNVRTTTNNRAVRHCFFSVRVEYRALAVHATHHSMQHLNMVAPATT